eukprot:15345208-Ditylum_brightwellii.AAC.1
MPAGNSKCKRFILAGNFIEMLNSTSDMIKFCADNRVQMVDTLGDLTNTSFSKTKSGKNRIDYIVMLPELITAVQKKDTTNLATKDCCGICTKDPQSMN